MTDYRPIIAEQFKGRVQFTERRPGVIQFIGPFNHEDGDPIEMFLESRSGSVRISDEGLTLMRLSYTFDPDTEFRRRVLERIVSENGLKLEGGKLFIDATVDNLYPYLMQFVQTIGKISSMRFFQRETAKFQFSELLRKIAMANFDRFHPQESCFPLPGQEEYEVEFCYNSRPRPVYLFGVNSSAKARLATISCLKFLNERLRFVGAVVLEDLDCIPKKDEARLFSAVDKVFPSLDDFERNGERFLERETA